MVNKQQRPLTTPQEGPPTPHAQTFSPNAPRARARTVQVRRGASGPIEQVQVPEGHSALHTGLERLQPGLDAPLVDEWFVIEE